MTGIPRVRDINHLGSGLELSNISFLGHLARDNGYYPVAMQSSKRTSFRIDSIARLSGFEEYYGAEDIPQRHLESSGLQPYFGTWDNNTLQFLLERIDVIVEEKQKPFLAFAFTSSTHTPFYSPGKEWELFEHDHTSIHGYLNTLYYADDVLGNFMEEAKTRNWFDNTVFIFMADHTVGINDKDFVGLSAGNPLKSRQMENMRIPMLIYSPALFLPGEEHRISSQADILPTLVDLLSWDGYFTSISHSVFSDAYQFALLGRGAVVSYVHEKGILDYGFHDATKQKTKKSSDEAKEKMQAIYQSLIFLLRKNKLFREEHMFKTSE